MQTQTHQHQPVGLSACPGSRHSSNDPPPSLIISPASHEHPLSSQSHQLINLSRPFSAFQLSQSNCQLGFQFQAGFNQLRPHPTPCPSIQHQPNLSPIQPRAEPVSCLNPQFSRLDPIAPGFSPRPQFGFAVDSLLRDMLLPLGQPLGAGCPPGTALLPAIPSRPDASLPPYPLPDHILPPNVLSHNLTRSPIPFLHPPAFSLSAPNRSLAVPKVTFQNVYSPPGAVSVGLIPGPSPTRIGAPFEDGFSCYVLPDKSTSTWLSSEQPQKTYREQTTRLLSEQQDSTPRVRPRKAPEVKSPPRPVGRPRKDSEPMGPRRLVGWPRKSSEPKPPPRPAGRPRKSVLTTISSASELFSSETDSEHEDDLVRSAFGAAQMVSSSLSEHDEARTLDSASGFPTEDGPKDEPSAGDGDEHQTPDLAAEEVLQVKSPIGAREAASRPKAQVPDSTETSNKVDSRVGYQSESPGAESHPQLPSHPNAEAPIRSCPSSPAHSDASSSAPCAQVGSPVLHDRPVAYPVIGDRFESLDTFKQACWTASWAAGHDMRFSATHIFSCRNHSSPTNCPFKIVVCKNKLPTATEAWQVVEVEMEHRNHSFKPGDIDPTRTHGWRRLRAKGALPQQTPPAAARPRRSFASLTPPALKQTKLSELFANPTVMSHLKRKASSSESIGGADGTSTAGSSGGSKRVKY